MSKVLSKKNIIDQRTGQKTNKSIVILKGSKFRNPTTIKYLNGEEESVVVLTGGKK